MDTRIEGRDAYRVVFTQHHDLCLSRFITGVKLNELIARVCMQWSISRTLGQSFCWGQNFPGVVASLLGIKNKAQ